MRLPTTLPLAALALMVLATGARAQYGDDGGYSGRHRRHRDEAADSTLTLTGRWQVWGHAGVDWIATPVAVRERYNAGFGVGVSGDRRIADHVALRARIDYHDLPSTQPTFYYVNASGFATAIDYGHGSLTTGTAGLAVRPWSHVWLEGGGGGGYFASGFSTETVTDPVTGAVQTLVGHSGWGGVWGAGVRYEFQPWRRDRLLAELQAQSMRRGGVTLTAWAIRAGVRFL